MRITLITAGDYFFEDEPLNKGLIGGKVIARNYKTGEENYKIYKRFHTGKTNKFEILEQLMYELVPPPPEEEKEENERTAEET